MLTLLAKSATPSKFEPRDPLHDLPEEDEESDEIDGATSSALAVGQSFHVPRAHALSDADAEEHGRKVEIARQAALRVRYNRKSS